MEIGERDMILMKLNEQLNVLSNYKLERVKELQEKVKDNKLLEKVVNDYKIYDNKMIEMKKQQAQQIEYLLLYLEKSVAEAGITDHMVQQAQYQKKELERQIKHLSSNMKSLI
jgi:hypothetical protein